MSFFSRNIDNKGRLLRGISSVVLLVSAGFVFMFSIWIGVALFVSGIFVAFEALRGWCVMRACGIKTRL
jgi:hypothetical protein